MQENSPRSSNTELTPEEIKERLDKAMEEFSEKMRQQTQKIIDNIPPLKIDYQIELPPIEPINLQAGFTVTRETLPKPFDPSLILTPQQSQLLYGGPSNLGHFQSPFLRKVSRKPKKHNQHYRVQKHRHLLLPDKCIQTLISPACAQKVAGWACPTNKAFNNAPNR